MNRMLKNKTLITLFLLLVTVPAVLSQVVVERSRDRIIISGIPYYLHLVKKGETAYSISKAYGITTEELLKENPEISAGLKDGQSLRIKVSMVDTAPVSQQPPLPAIFKDETKYVYHILQPGETIYRLSKTYDVTEEELIKSNPGVDISKLPVGFEIAIPRKKESSAVQTISGRDPNAYYHKVSRGETMYSISRQYGITVRELRRANGDTRFPQVGDYLKIPGKKPVPEKVVVPEIIEETPELVVQEAEYKKRPSGYTSVSDLTGSFNVAVLLPFYLSENEKRREIDSSKSVKGKKIYREINRSDDWIYPRSLGFVEMYEGMLLAADTLRALGLNIRMNVFDVGADSIGARRLLNSGKLDGMDLIIGPVYSEIMSFVAEYAGKRGIPIVSPVQLENNMVLRNNPTLFMSVPSIDIAQAAMAEKLKEYHDRNIVLIQSKLAKESEGVVRLRNLIADELASLVPGEDVKIRTMDFVSRSSLRKDSVNRLAYSLSDKTGNVVIIASEDSPVMSESITDIHALARKYNINVFGYPAMRYLDNIDHKICFDLGLMIYSPYWIDYSAPDVKQFNSVFRKKFLTEPSEISYAWQGYDILYYFLSGIAIHGREFLSHPEIHNPDLLHTEFDFRRNGLNDGFENQKLYLIRYSNNYELELVSGGNYAAR
jgi:LysM repeat protein/ABC-type branched-subunit amino acid transport system substrate-binding protein